MYKLKDIFSLNLNSKGGAKLYRKIMGKYNIPLKDAKELRQKIVESSQGNDSAEKEGDLIYYKSNEGVRLNLYPIKDSITQIAVGKVESQNNLSVSDKNAFVDISQIEIYEDGSMVFTATNGAGFNIMSYPAFIYKVGSDLKTAEDIIGSDAITKTTKEEYDNIFNI